MVHPNLLTVVPKVQELVVPAKFGGTIGRRASEAPLPHMLPGDPWQDAGTPSNWQPRVVGIVIKARGPDDHPVGAIQDGSAVGGVVHTNDWTHVRVGAVRRHTNPAVRRGLWASMARGRKPKRGEHVRPGSGPEATVIGRDVVEVAERRVGADVLRGGAASGARACRGDHVGTVHGLSGHQRRPVARVRMGDNAAGRM